MSNTVIVTWTEWLENWTIGRLAEGASADEYLNTLPADRTAFAFDTDAADWLGAQWRERFTCPQLVQIFNTIRDTTVPAVTKFENKDAALRRLTGQMIARARELPEVGAVPPTQAQRKERAVSEEGTKKRGRMATGQPANAEKFKPGRVKPGTARGRVLALMDGTRTGADIDAEMSFKAGYSMSHFYCLARDCGVGYAFDSEQRVRALYPLGQTLDTALGAAKEPKAA